MARLLKKLGSNESVLAVAMIALTGLITHGLMIPTLGYYYDDWYMLWSGASRGAESLITLFSIDRPFMGVIYSYAYRVIEDSIAGWHLFALLWRILGAIAFYWILNMAWPKLKSMFVFAAMIFVVFPGFLAEPNAATKINHLIGYGAALFSIAFTLQAALTNRRAWKYACIALAILLMAFYVWIYEYMFGLEVMRVALLYWLLWQGQRNQAWAAVKKIIPQYIPYALVLLMFVIWRVFFFRSIRPATDLKGLVTDYQTNFFDMVLRLIFQVVKDFFSASTFAWFVQPYNLLARSEYSEILIALLFTVIMVLLAAGFVIVRRKLTGAVQEDGEQEFAGQGRVMPSILVLIGALITLGAVFPVVLFNRHIDLMDPYKGYALHPSAGVIIMLVGIATMMKPSFRTALFIAVLGFSVATQSLNIQRWANFWEIEKGVWWQLTWRAPNIRDYTLVMTYLPEGYAFQQDYEIWGPVNLIYRQEPEHFPLIESEVLNQDTALYVFEGKFMEPHVRDIYLPRDYRNYLLISQPTTRSCIHVIDGKMPAYSASERPLVEKVGRYSNIALIETAGKAPTPPAAIFGQEPERGWCYYYQQASLARQVGDWPKIGELYNAAAAAALKPGDSSEYFVFIEGLVNAGRAGEAKTIADEEIKKNPALKYSLCKSLSAAPKYPAKYGYKLNQINQVVCDTAAE